MFKNEFNSIYVAVKDFILESKTLQEFIKIDDEISFYRSIVDEYNSIVFNLTNIKNQIAPDHYLNTEIDEVMTQLNATFNNYYEQSMIVRSYVSEIANLKSKATFNERLYRFEQSLIAQPIVKIEVDVIQELMLYAKEYASSSQTYYYFGNNPFEIDEILNVVIPIKYTFENSEKFLTSVYNYVFGLYNTYLYNNKDALAAMQSLEKTIEEKNYEYLNVLNISKKNKYKAVKGTTSEEYYNAIEHIKDEFKKYEDQLLSLGVYRFTKQTTIFEKTQNEIKKLIDEYSTHELYIAHINEIDYSQKIGMLHDYIHLIEDGKINTEKDYILTDISFKELVEHIIKLSRELKRKIYYTQKYNISGIPKLLEFEFYQTDLFVTSIKTYYYQLMTENIYTYTKLTIDDFGDSSINDIRETYKQMLSKYDAIKSQDISFLNEFEYQEYYNEFIKIQEKLKIQSARFFEAANKTSPATYVSVMDQQYSAFLQQLKEDVENINNRHLKQIIEITDENKIQAKVIVENVKDHIDSIKYIMDCGNKYVFIGLQDYMETKIFNPFNEFFNTLKQLYNSENYIDVLKTYNDRFDSLVFDFNLLNSMEKFSKMAEIIFSYIDNINKFYISEQISGKHITGLHDDEILFLEDLFGDDTYKVTRNELFMQLDLIYEFIIDSKPNEKSFLINEKNLKKLYFDNQYMKINYIRWYHRLLIEKNKYDSLNISILKNNEEYIKNKEYIETFGYKKRLESLIIQQNKILSEITKSLVDYSAEINYQTINGKTDIIMNIELYNNIIEPEIIKYADIVRKLQLIQEITETDNEKSRLEINHKKQWLDIIESNTISEPEKVSYNEMDVIKSSVPLSVVLEAKMETLLDVNGKEIKGTYTWFIEDLIKEGNKITHTFYEEGIQKVRCELRYENGDKMSKYIEFALSGPQNNQIVKTGKQIYSPLTTHPEQPKITYLDPTTKKMVTMVVKIDGDISTMIGDGSIKLSEDGDLKEDNIGKVIIGFEGKEFAGSDFEYSKIFDDGFEMPEESEFLFDFNVSTPIAGTSTIDISKSKYTKFIAKIPSKILSVYEIDKASAYDSIGTLATIAMGDKLILKNDSGRYAILEIGEITHITKSDESKYYYSIEYKYFVNTSLNKNDRDNFKPSHTSMTIPTIYFKTNVTTLFNTLIDRLETLNRLKDKLNSTTDLEMYETIKTQIDDLERENQTFYLFTELDKVKSKYNTLGLLYKELEKKYFVDYSLNTDEINKQIKQYKKHINNTKTFKEYMNSTNAYEFKKNLIDLKILLDLYKDQQTILELIIDTYSFKDKNITFFENKIKELRILSANGFVDNTLSYGEMLVKMIKKLRELLFKVKLIINYPIMVEGKHLVMSVAYLRPQENMDNHTWTMADESDLFLLNKKLELKYGYEIGKVENNKPYKEFIGEIVSMEKELFGNGLSADEIKSLSKYIQKIEELTISEYDDFFMIPFWIDYLEKNV